MSTKNVLAMALFCVFGILTSPVNAATIYWTGSQGTGNWSTVNAGASNWSTDAAGTINYGQAPQNGDDLNFNATNATILTTTNDMTGLVVNSITFVNASFANAVTINGNSFTISPSAATVGITNTNATTGRNVTINAPIVIGAAQTWTASVTNAITILNGNLSGSANVTITGNASNSTTLPNIRLGGSNSSYTGTLDSSAGSSGVLLAAPAAMTGGLINISGSNANLWLTGNTAGSPYTMGLSNTAGSPNVITRNAGTSGIYLTGGDVYWDPGNGGDYTWSNNTNTELRIDGSNDTTPRMLHFGNSTGKLILSGGNRSIAGGNGGNNPGRVNLLFALADDAQATARVFSAITNLLILNRPSINNVTGATKSSISITTGTSSSTGTLAVTDLSQLFAGNLKIDTGTLILDNISWSAFTGARTLGTGNGQFQLSSTGGFAARTADVVIDATGTTASTFDRTLTLGSGVLANDGTLYANKKVFLARDTTLTAGRTINVPNNGTAFGSTPAVLNKVSGNLSGAGSVTVTGVSNTTTPGELVLSGTNTWTGGVSPAINTGIFFNSGPGGMNINFAFVRFDGASSLPTGNGGSLAYVGAVERNNAAQMGFLLTGGVAPVTYSMATNMKFLIGGMSSGENVGTLGADGGLAVLQNASVLVHTDSSSALGLNLFVRANSVLTLGTGGNPVRFIPSKGNSASTSSAATTVLDATGQTRTPTKRGDGTLVLGNLVYTDVAETGLTGSQFKWQIGRGSNPASATTVQTDGAVRETTASFLTGYLLGGGVLEIDGGVYGGAYSINANSTQSATVATWIAGGGGFAAINGDVSLTVNNGTGGNNQIGWSGTPVGLTTPPTGVSNVSAGASLMFGSRTGDSTLILPSGGVPINLGSSGSGDNPRGIQVLKDTNNAKPELDIRSGIFGNANNPLVLTGDGAARFTATATFSGQTRIYGGTALINGNVTAGSNGPLGNPGATSSANNPGSTSYRDILLGSNVSTDGNSNAAILTDGAFTVARNLVVQAGNSGTATFGGNTADSSTFSGAVTLNKNVAITTVSGGIVNVTGAISGAGAVTKTGAGTAVLGATNSYSGATTVAAGTLAGTGTLSSSSIVVNSGATLAPGTPGGALGTLTAVAADFSAGGKLNVRITNAGNDLLQVTGTGANSLNMTGGALNVDLTGFDNSAAPNVAIVVAQGPTWSATGFTTITFTPSNFPATVRYVNNGSGSNTSKQVIVALNGNVTPVKVADFSARADVCGALVSWTAVSEYQNAGFNIYRRSLESAEWVKANPVLINGRITNPDEKKYAYFDWAPAGLYEYKLESVELSGAREVYEKLTDVVEVDRKSAFAESTELSAETVESASRSVDMATGDQLAQRVESLFAARRAARVSSTLADAPKIESCTAREIPAGLRTTFNVPAMPDSPQAAVGVRWFTSGTIGTASGYSAAKVLYKDSGVLLIQQTSMPKGYDLNQVSIQREGRSVNALAKVPGGLLVYAPGYKDEYTDKDAIFLRKTNTATISGSSSAATGLFFSMMPVNVTVSNTVTTEFHDVYFDYNVRPFVFAPWFSGQYLTQGSTQNFTVNLPDVVSSSAGLVVNVWSLTSSTTINPDHGLQVLVNGQAVGETNWDGGGKMLQLSFTIPPGALKTGDNVVSLITPTFAGLDSQIAFLHSISVNYTRALDGSKQIEINNAGKTASLCELYNVPPGGAWVVDARFGDRATLVSTESRSQADGTLRMRFIAAAGGSGKYLVVPVGQERQPLGISSRQVKPLKLIGTYLATGPAQFASGVQPLLTKRSKEGIRNAFVDQEQLFDYYNYGRYGPDGIRNAVRSVRPAYLLLVGRTSYDYLNYGGANVDPLCPAFLVSTNFWAQTTSDSAFGDLGRGFPEVAVGRLPVNNTSELAGAVSHIVNYKGLPASGVRLHAVADKADPLVADFGAQLDIQLKASYPDVFWQENYLGRTYATAPEVTAAMKVAANGGADLILYSGHGNAARLGADAPRILDQTSVQDWTGNTVFIQATCTAHWMAKNEQDYKSIAIQALTQSQGGIAASIGTSTYMNPDVTTAFMNQLLKNTNGSGVRWGAVLLKTQQWAGTQSGSAFYKDLMTTEQLFGDPAMPVYAPKLPAPAPGTAGTF